MISCLVYSIQLAQNAKDSTLTRVKKIPSGISLSFGGFIEKSNSLFLRITDGMLNLFSLTTLYFLPDSFDSFVFNRISAFQKVEMLKKSLISLSFGSSMEHTIKQKSVENLLCAFRDIISYTNLRKLWDSICHSLLRLHISYFTAKLISQPECLTLARIEIFIGDFSLAYVFIDPVTSHVNIDYLLLIRRKIQDLGPLQYIDTYNQIALPISYQITEIITGQQAEEKRVISNSKRFSFGPDFLLTFKNFSSNGYPQIQITDRNQNEYTTPYIVELNHSQANFSWNHLLPAVQSAKALILTLQIKNELDLLKVNSYVSGSLIEVYLPGCSSVSICIHPRRWKITWISENNLTDEPIYNQQIIIRGYRYTARIAKCIVQTLIQLNEWMRIHRIIAKQGRKDGTLRLDSILVTSLSFKEEDKSIFFLFGNEMEEMADHSFEWKGPIKPWNISTTGFSFPIQTIIPTGQELSGFVHFGIYPITRLFACFNSPDWTFLLHNSANLLNFLIYKRKYSIAFKQTITDSTNQKVMFILPSVAPTKYVAWAVLSSPTITSPIKTEIASLTFSVNGKQILELKRRIEWMANVLEVFENAQLEEKDNRTIKFFISDFAKIIVQDLKLSLQMNTFPRLASTLSNMNISTPEIGLALLMFLERLKDSDPHVVTRTIRALSSCEMTVSGLKSALIGQRGVTMYVIRNGEEVEELLS